MSEPTDTPTDQRPADGTPADGPDAGTGSGSRENPFSSRSGNVLGGERSMVGRTARDLAAGEYPGLILPSPYWDVLGEPRPWFKMLVYGTEGSGKSTFATGLCKSYMPYARHMGAKVMYCSSEEGPSDTTADRIKRLNVREDRLYVTSFSTVEELKDVIEAENAQYVVLDSASSLSSQRGQGVDLFKFCENQGRAITIIAHENSRGKAAKGRGMRHECGIEIRCHEEQWPPGKAKQWGLDIDAPERQGEDGQIIVHLAYKEKNRFGGRVKEAPIPMQETEIRETVPPQVINRRIRKLQAHNQWPVAQGHQTGQQSVPVGGATGDGEPLGGEETAPGQRPNATNGQRAEGLSDQADPPEATGTDGAGEPAPNGVGQPGGEPGRDERRSARTNQTPPRSQLAKPPMRTVRTNPVDLDEFDSFTLRELIENNGNAARSISYLNKFIGWERGCVAAISTNESPGYRTEDGAELMDQETMEAEDGDQVVGKLLSFTYERFPKSTARPEAVAVTRMYLNDKLVDTICEDTAAECIDVIKERYGDIEIKVLSQEHLEDAFGVEEYRRLEREIPLQQDEDTGTAPEEVEGTDARAGGFDQSELGRRGHINIDSGLIDSRVITLAEEAAEGEFSGIEDDQGRVLSDDEIPATADSAVELFGTTYVFYPTDEFELETATGATFFVGSMNNRGDSSRAESLFAFGFGLETEIEETGEPEAEEAPEEPEPETEEEEEPSMTEEVEEAEGPPSSMEMFNNLIEDLPGSIETGHFGTTDEEPRPKIDNDALEIFIEMAESVNRDEVRGRGLVQMEIGDLTVKADEEGPSGFVMEEPAANAPFWTLLVVENDEDIGPEDLLLALQDADLMNNATLTLSDEEEEEEPETLDEALSTLGELAAEVDPDLVPGGFGQTAQGFFVGGDAVEILQTVADESSQRSFTLDVAGETLTYSLSPEPTKFIGTEENGAFLLEADSADAEDLGVRGLMQPLIETGAMDRQSVNEQITEPEEEEEPEPEPEPEPPSEPEGDDESEQSAFEETSQRLDEAIGAIEDL